MHIIRIIPCNDGENAELRIQMTAEQAASLVKAIQAGHFTEFGITEATVIASRENPDFAHRDALNEKRANPTTQSKTK